MSAEALEISQETGGAPQEVPPIEKIIPYITGQWIARSLYVVAKQSVADFIGEGCHSVDELAVKAELHPHSLFRVLRALASVGFFTEVRPREFELTELGACLKKDAPGAIRSTILTLAGQLQWESWGETLHSVRTGETGIKKAVGKTLFDYLGEHPEEAGWFNDTMASFHGPEAPAIAQAYDFPAGSTVVDLGGGSGTLLAAIMDAHPQVTSVLLDLPHAACEARERFQNMGLSDRATAVEGSFFESVPEGDVYILSHVIHDWTDEQCVSILKNCKQANPAAKVLIIELVLPSGDAFHPGKLIDLQMLALLGGQERTETEYANLFSEAGYKLARVVPTQSRVGILEGVPA